VDLACYVLYKTQGGFTPEVLIMKMHKTVKEQTYYFKEAGRRYYQTGNTIVSAGLPIVTDSLKCVYSGIDLYLHSGNKVQLFNPYMWAFFVLSLLLYAVTGYSASLLIMFAAMVTAAPYKLWELRRKREDYRASVLSLRNSWSHFSNRFSNDCADIMVLPAHVNVLSVLGIAMTTVVLFKFFSKSKVKVNSEASVALTARNSEIDSQAKVGSTLIRFRETPLSWNVVTGPIPKHTSDLKVFIRKWLATLK
jgi:hypothetical protein